LHSDTSSTTGARRVSPGRLRLRRLSLGLAVAGAVAVPLGVALAGAAGPSLEQRLDSANSEADRLSGRIEGQVAEIAELEQRAREAGAREMELSAEIEVTSARSRELAGELAAAAKELERVRAEYRKAVGALSDRLVQIYKGTEPDNASVLLGSEDFDELQSNATYLDALHDADQRIAGRVEALREEAASHHERIAGVKAEIDEQAQRLEAAQTEFAAAEVDAQQRIAAVGEARAAAQSDLSEVQGTIEELEQEQLESSGASYQGGPYSIPTYIVMCESRGNYSALNSSSGAGGAYQILPSTWRAYGGSGLPHQASKAEQDRIAAMIWADSGPSAWACA
jgi:septal ring factor EnvC (AmiA/AmiB activator)